MLLPSQSEFISYWHKASNPSNFRMPAYYEIKYQLSKLLSPKNVKRIFRQVETRSLSKDNHCIVVSNDAEWKTQFLIFATTAKEIFEGEHFKKFIIMFENGEVGQSHVKALRKIICHFKEFLDFIMQSSTAANVSPEARNLDSSGYAVFVKQVTTIVSLLELYLEKEISCDNFNFQLKSLEESGVIAFKKCRKPSVVFQKKELRNSLSIADVFQIVLSMFDCAVMGSVALGMNKERANWFMLLRFLTILEQVCKLYSQNIMALTNDEVQRIMDEMEAFLLMIYQYQLSNCEQTNPHDNTDVIICAEFKNIFANFTNNLQRRNIVSASIKPFLKILAKKRQSIKCQYAFTKKEYAEMDKEVEQFMELALKKILKKS